MLVVQEFIGCVFMNARALYSTSLLSVQYVSKAANTHALREMSAQIPQSVSSLSQYAWIGKILQARELFEHVLGSAGARSAVNTPPLSATAAKSATSGAADPFISPSFPPLPFPSHFSTAEYSDWGAFGSAAPSPLSVGFPALAGSLGASLASSVPPSHQPMPSGFLRGRPLLLRIISGGVDVCAVLTSVNQSQVLGSVGAASLFVTLMPAHTLSVGLNVKALSVAVRGRVMEVMPQPCVDYSSFTQCLSLRWDQCSVFLLDTLTSTVMLQGKLELEELALESDAEDTVVSASGGSRDAHTQNRIRQSWSAGVRSHHVFLPLITTPLTFVCLLTCTVLIAQH